MEQDLIKIKYAIQDLIDKYPIKDIYVHIDKNISGQEYVTLKIEV